MSRVRHLITTRVRVVELYEAGWRTVDIQRLLEQEGFDVPSRNTIWVWTHPDKGAAQARRDLAKTRQWRTARATFSWPGLRGPEWRLGRMLSLREAGLGFNAIAKVMSHDFPGEPLTHREVEYAIKGARPPRSLRHAA